MPKGGWSQGNTATGFHFIPIHQSGREGDRFGTQINERFVEISSVHGGIGIDPNADIHMVEHGSGIVGVEYFGRDVLMPERRFFAFMAPIAGVGCGVELDQEITSGVFHPFADCEIFRDHFSDIVFHLRLGPIRVPRGEFYPVRGDTCGKQDHDTFGGIQGIALAERFSVHGGQDFGTIEWFVEEGTDDGHLAGGNVAYRLISALEVLEKSNGHCAADEAVIHVVWPMILTTGGGEVDGWQAGIAGLDGQGIIGPPSAEDYPLAMAQRTLVIPISFDPEGIFLFEYWIMARLGGESRFIDGLARDGERHRDPLGFQESFNPHFPVGVFRQIPSGDKKYAF